MSWSFTAAAERALAEAAGWSSRADRDELDTPELLLGLLAEEECRAAQMLLARGVGSAQVAQRWPGLHRNGKGERRDFSPAVTTSILAAVDRLWAYPRPLHLATEHLLLGLAAVPGEAADWLGQYGLWADDLEAQIHELYGHRPGPFPLETPIDVDETSAGPESAYEAAVTEPSPQIREPFAAQKEDLVARESPPVRPPLIPPFPLDGREPGMSLLRVIDAAANRAREGLRVVEDYVRMVLDDRNLTSELKSLRHELAAALSCFANADLLAARDTLGDVGTSLSTEAEFTRANPGTVAAANWKRLQEALRSLEEYTKVTKPDVAAILERLRYRSYTLERAVVTVRASVARLASVRLCVLVDGQGSEAEFVRMIDGLVDAGVGMIQLRDKRLADAELLERARTLCKYTGCRDVIAIINDRADIAALSRADGVHVGQDDLPIRAARAIVGAQALVGCSTHSLEQARQAVFKGANYIGVGPTFPSTTKNFETFTGVELLTAVAAEIRLPAFAIGGVNLSNLDAVMQAGFSRVAVSGAVVAAADPKLAASEIVARMSQTR